MTRLLFLLTLVLLPMLDAGAQPMGRLFLSPNERALLDQLRYKNGMDAAPAATTPAADNPTDEITLNGFVKRSNGKTTTWINRLPQHEYETPQGITVLDTSKPSAVSLQLRSGKKIDLKAGQTFDNVKGAVREAYETPAPPPPEIAKPQEPAK
jgi:hypothetical protein